MGIHFQKPMKVYVDADVTGIGNSFERCFNRWIFCVDVLKDCLHFKTIFFICFLRKPVLSLVYFCINTGVTICLIVTIPARLIIKKEE